MTALSDFQHSIASARSLTLMYAELRRARGLGRRGKLTTENQDLLWLPRSAIVAAISALDAYIHAVLYEKIPHALRQQPVPDALCDALSGILPIKNGSTFREALPVILSSDPEAKLIESLKSESLSFLSYQDPSKILLGYRLIGKDNIFADVADIWPGPRTTDADIRQSLANYVKRRNQIAHEGDRESGGGVRAMQPIYADGCTEFVDNLVSRLNRCVYGV